MQQDIVEEASSLVDLICESSVMIGMRAFGVDTSELERAQQNARAALQLFIAAKANGPPSTIAEASRQPGS